MPVLKGFPAQYIYEPWNAPEELQKSVKCIIGVHYPKPMVNHAEASRVNIERMKQIYQQLSCYRGLGRNMTRILITSYSHFDARLRVYRVNSGHPGIHYENNPIHNDDLTLDVKANMLQSRNINTILHLSTPKLNKHYSCVMGKEQVAASQ